MPRPPIKNREPCLQCKNTFKRRTTKEKFCGRNCYFQHKSENHRGENHHLWKNKPVVEKQCEICSTVFTTRKNKILCSKKCAIQKFAGLPKKGAANVNWKGGRIGGNGWYVCLLMPEHPKCNKMGYIQEHRYVMEQELGRYLEKYEVVHHKNGKKDDNRLSNLVVMTKREHDKMHLDEYRKKRSVKLKINQLT